MSIHPGLLRHDGSRRSRGRRWCDRLFIAAGAALLLLYLSALVSIVPDRVAVASEKKGITALRDGRYREAQARFTDVVKTEPRSTHARFGLACTLYLTKRRDLAVIALNTAIDRGLVLRRAGTCGHGLTFNDHFFVAKFGFLNAFAVPRINRRYQHLLESIPIDNKVDTASRLLIGSCLGFRARLDELGWYYAANAHDLGSITANGVANFFDCLGSRTRGRIGCGRSIQCVLRSPLRSRFEHDSPLVFLPNEGDT